MRRPLLPIVVPLLLGLAACGPEPFDRPGTWRATGANEANLRAMLVEPAQLSQGVAPVVPTRGETAANAAARLGARSSGGGGGAGVLGARPGGGTQSSGAQAGIPALPPPMGMNNVRN